MQCGDWNTLIEDVINIGKKEELISFKQNKNVEPPKSLSSIKKSTSRIQSGMSEMDQVLGGGFVNAGLVLLCGEPGIGKSTLTLQIVNNLSKSLDQVIYITGEESIEQIAERAGRMQENAKNLKLLYENNLENILKVISQEKVDFLVIDSIQVMTSSEIKAMAGGISQVRFVTEMIMNCIKTYKIPTLLIGHVNKDGDIAGPKVLEHLVDTVLILEGKRDHSLRILRSIKNRFGCVSEIGLFEMTENGLKEIINPGAYVLKHRPKDGIGSCLTVSMEGNRPLLMEVQALTVKNSYGMLKRTASGFDRNRLELLIAVLQKHTHLNLSDQDVYVNIVGGMSLKDPAADLAVCLAIASSVDNRPLPENLVAFGEVGLTGEIRGCMNSIAREKLCKKSQLTILKKNKDLANIILACTKS